MIEVHTVLPEVLPSVRTSVLPYLRKYGSTFVLYFVRKYFRTSVLYCTFEGNSSPSYCVLRSPSGHITYSGKCLFSLEKMRIVNRSVQRCTTTLLYGSTFVQYFRTSGSTKVLSYFRTTYVTTYCKLRRYEGNSLRRYESTKVRKYFRKYFRTNVLSKVLS
jgi:hypothetical protein